MNNERLGHILLKQGALEVQELDFCLSVQKNNGRQKLGQLLCHYNFVDEMSIIKAVAGQVGWNVFEGDYTADESMVSLFGVDFLFERMVIPIRTKEGVIFVLTQTNDTQTTDLINQKLGDSSLFYLGLERKVQQSLEQLREQQRIIKDQDKDGVVHEEQLGQWFENCLSQAIVQLASDIHIEPSQKVVEIRFRIDGILCFVETLPLKCLARLINIIFHKAEVAISDFSHFHDAKFLYQHLNKQVDVRVSHIPSIHGSSLVLRLLDKSKAVKDLSQLGYSPQTWSCIQDHLIKPDGISLIVGPTGCGKTTTLYGILNHLKSIDSKIVTIEDPVEIQLPLMTQLQIHEKRGITFSQSVRAFLRHDPDIILIGEIRDELTAQEALRAAMTGHQIFATMHTNRALDAILRLNDFGLPFTHMADHLSMIVSQRLVRQLCLVCKKESKVGKEEYSKYQDRYLEKSDQTIFTPQGCSACRNGFLGQTIVAEVLIVNDVIGEFIALGHMGELKKFLRESNCVTMADDARRLITQGVTSLSEVVRVLG